VTFPKDDLKSFNYALLGPNSSRKDEDIHLEIKPKVGGANRQMLKFKVEVERRIL
jgi:hypothetical protein